MLGRKKPRSFRPGRREALVGAVLVVVVLLERLRGRGTRRSQRPEDGEATREQAVPPVDYAPPED